MTVAVLPWETFLQRAVCVTSPDPRHSDGKYCEGNARNIEIHICILSQSALPGHSKLSRSLIRAINIICQTHEYFYGSGIL